MATRVLLTIDTELAYRPYARGAGWRENFALSCEPAGVGISYQLERLRRHDLKACFFVDPMPGLVYGLDPVRAMIEPILAAGQEVQLHLHSYWADLARNRRDGARFELTAFGGEEQKALIAAARDLLVEAGAPPPIAFRAGCYAADANTLAALADLGIDYDSSHNGAEHPRLSALPFDPAQADPIGHDGIVEIPISQIRTPSGGLRPLQICALSFAEMEAALGHAAVNGHPLVTIVGHGFELASRDGRRVNALVRRRFDRLCAFLDEERTALPTATFAGLDAAALLAPRLAPSQPLPARRLRTARRIAEQAWGDARYERRWLPTSRPEPQTGMPG
jgi:hypothetical protein